MGSSRSGSPTMSSSPAISGHHRGRAYPTETDLDRRRSTATVYTTATIAGPSPTGGNPTPTYTTPVTAIAPSTSAGLRRRRGRATCRTAKQHLPPVRWDRATTPSVMLTLIAPLRMAISTPASGTASRPLTPPGNAEPTVTSDNLNAHQAAGVPPRRTTSLPSSTSRWSIPTRSPPARSRHRDRTPGRGLGFRSAKE
jgi:hypothetical protein